MYLRLTNSRFCVIWARTKYAFWSASDSFHKKVDTKNTQDGNLVNIFSWGKKKQNSDCNVRTFRRFLFGMSPDVPIVKVCVLTGDFKFWIEVNGFLIRFCVLFWLSLPCKFCEKYQFVVHGFSLVCAIRKRTP